ncbi:MAG: ATP-dependent chaperone ClpB, partial [Bauldia litoralis]
TSNLGSDYLAGLEDNQGVDEVRDMVMGVVRSHFRPEFLNRLDDIILFHRLKRSEMGAIVDIQLKRLQGLLEERKIAIDLDESARKWLADKGYDPTYGARPLKRVIQREVQDPLADKILAGEVPDGAKVKITGGTDKLLFLPQVTGGRKEEAA